MIHIDRNHHPAKQNLINDHKIIWSDYLPSLDAVHPDLPTQDHPKSLTGPATPTGPHDPVASHVSSPSSPADGNSASPTRDRSSSLSPAPETSLADSPPPPPQAEEKEAPVVAPQREEEEEEEEAKDPPSRLSTPLSELSSSPDQEDHEAFNGDDMQPTRPENATAENALPDGADTKAKSGGELPTNTRSPPTRQKPSREGIPSADPRTRHDSNPAGTMTFLASSSIHRQHSTSNLSSQSINAPATPTSATGSLSPANVNDPKVVSMLELNAELLKSVTNLPIMLY